jgi:hypothetical protein
VAIGCIFASIFTTFYKKGSTNFTIYNAYSGNDISCLGESNKDICNIDIALPFVAAALGVVGLLIVMSTDLSFTTCFKTLMGLHFTYLSIFVLAFLFSLASFALYIYRYDLINRYNNSEIDLKEGFVLLTTGMVLLLVVVIMASIHSGKFMLMC